MSGHGTIETAVEATRIGALDFLEKPIALQRLLATVKRALRNQEARAPRRARRSRRSAARRRSPSCKKRLGAARAGRRAAAAARRARHARRALRARCSPRPARRSSPAPSCSRSRPRSCSAQAAGGILFVARPGAARPRASRRTSSSCCARAEKHKVRAGVVLAARCARRWPRSATSTPELARAARASSRCSCRRCASSPRTCRTSPRCMLAQLVEARACPPRRFVDRGAQRAAPLRLAGQPRRAARAW